MLLREAPPSSAVQHTRGWQAWALCTTCIVTLKGVHQNCAQGHAMLRLQWAIIAHSAHLVHEAALAPVVHLVLHRLHLICVIACA